MGEDECRFQVVDAWSMIAFIWCLNFRGHRTYVYNNDPRSILYIPERLSVAFFTATSRKKKNLNNMARSAVFPSDGPPFLLSKRGFLEPSSSIGCFLLLGSSMDAWT